MCGKIKNKIILDKKQKIVYNVTIEIQIGAVAQLGERYNRTVEVRGSSPLCSIGEKRIVWGRSSAGRAFEWHSKGQGFEPPRLHLKSHNSFNAIVAFEFHLYLRMAPFCV